jgi:hypothetical protein
MVWRKWLERADMHALAIELGEPRMSYSLANVSPQACDARSRRVSAQQGANSVTAICSNGS